MSEVDVAVLGAGGKTGKLIVTRLLAQNKTVRAVVRSVDKYASVWPANGNLTIVKGDVTDPASLGPALSGAKTVIFAATTATFLGAKAVDKLVTPHFGGCVIARNNSDTQNRRERPF